MKRIAIFVLIVIMLFTFTSCGENKNTPSDDVTSPERLTTQSVSESEQVTESTTQKLPERKIFKVGVIMPDDSSGTSVKNAAMLAAEKINAGGEIQLELNFASEGKNGEAAVTAYDTLKAWGMQIVIGPVSLYGAERISEKSNAERVFNISLCQSKLTSRDNVVEFCAADSDRVVSAVRYLMSETEFSEVAVIYQSDDENSEQIKSNFTAAAEKNGLKVVYTGSFDTDTAHDFSVQLSSCINKSATAVLLPIQNEHAALIAEQAEAMGYSPLFIGFDEFEAVSSMENFKKEFAERAVALTAFSVNFSDSNAAEFLSSYNTAYSENPDKYAAYAFDAVNFLYNAVVQSSVRATSDTEKICKKLLAQAEKTDYNGITGKGMYINENGEFFKIPVAVDINSVYTQ